MTVQHGVIEFVGRSDSDWAGDQATRQCITGHHCSVHGVTMYRGQKQTSVSLCSCEPEFYAASACAGELLGLAELFKERCSSSRMDSDSARHILQRRGPGGLMHVGKRCWASHNGSDKKVCQLDAWIRKTTPQISSRHIWMDRERGRSHGN